MLNTSHNTLNILYGRFLFGEGQPYNMIRHPSLRGEWAERQVREGWWQWSQFKKPHMREDIIMRENIENMREQFFNYIFLCCRNGTFFVRFLKVTSLLIATLMHKLLVVIHVNRSLPLLFPSKLNSHSYQGKCFDSNHQITMVKQPFHR